MRSHTQLRNDKCIMTYIPSLIMIDVKTILLSAKVIFIINLSDLFLESKPLFSHDGKMASMKPNSVNELNMHNKYIINHFSA